LARQLLLSPRALPVEQALEHLVGMQAQEPQAPYLGLASRLADFDPRELSELIAEGRAVRGSLMRATIHLVTARDWGRLRPLIDPVLARLYKGSQFSRATTGVDLPELLETARSLLTDRPRSRADLGQLLQKRWPDRDPTALAYAATLLMPLLQVPPRGLWRTSGQARWATPESWLGCDATGSHQPGPRAAEDLVHRYLAAFGPATVADIQAWSGLTRLAETVNRLRPELRTFEDELGRELLDLQDAPLPDPDTPARARILPPFDNAILSHAERTRIIDPNHRMIVSRDRLMRTFLLDGFVAGAWRLDTNTLHLIAFRPLRPSEREQLADEAERLAPILTPEARPLEPRFSETAV
jgi:hypothetical protein